MSDDIIFDNSLTNQYRYNYLSVYQESNAPYHTETNICQSWSSDQVSDQASHNCGIN
jgi:hypothetical protein